MASEFGFRPCKIEDLKGQPKVQKMLQIYIKAAQIKEESFPHTIITGQSGCGKTATANVIAHELGYGFKAFSGPAINDKKVIDEILLNLKENDVLFIDEIQSLTKKLQESLYFAMEQFQADVTVDGVATRVSLPHFTLIAATNLYGGLNDALLNRFPIQIKLAAYSKTDMASIVDSLVAPLSVINALVVALCMKKQDDVIETLETLEDIWDEYQVYSRDELEPVEDEVRIK